MAAPSRTAAQRSSTTPTSAEQVTPAAVMLMILLGCLFIGIGYYLFAFSPLTDKIKKERANKPNLEKERSDAKKDLDNYNDDSDRLHELTAKVEALNVALPPDANIPGFLRLITALCQANGLQVKLIQPQDEKIEQHFVRARVLLRMEGEYLALARFFHSISQQTRVINMENITLEEPVVTEDGHVHLRATVTATTFRALAPDEKPPEPANANGKPGTAPAAGAKR